MKNLDLSIGQGKFICVIGDVASGKSSFLSSIIGDLLYASPDFALNHSKDEITKEIEERLRAESNT